MTKLYRACALLLPLSVVALAGCGTTGAVMSVGPDTYMVTAQKHNLAGGLSSAQSNALEQANAKCAEEDKKLIVTNTTTDFDRPMYTFSATFRCLSRGDRDLTRPTYQQSPDVVIESR